MDLACSTSIQLRKRGQTKMVPRYILGQWCIKRDPELYLLEASQVTYVRYFTTYLYR